MARPETLCIDFFGWLKEKKSGKIKKSPTAFRRRHTRQRLSKGSENGKRACFVALCQCHSGILSLPLGSRISRRMRGRAACSSQHEKKPILLGRIPFYNAHFFAIGAETTFVTVSVRRSQNSTFSTEAQQPSSPSPSTASLLHQHSNVKKVVCNVASIAWEDGSRASRTHLWPAIDFV